MCVGSVCCSCRQVFLFNVVSLLLCDYNLFNVSVVGVVLLLMIISLLLCRGCIWLSVLMVEKSLCVFWICSRFVCWMVVFYVGFIFVLVLSKCWVVGFWLFLIIRIGLLCEVLWVVEIKWWVLFNCFRQSKIVLVLLLCVRQFSSLLILIFRLLFSVIKQEKFILCCCVQLRIVLEIVVDWEIKVSLFCLIGMGEKLVFSFCYGVRSLRLFGFSRCIL